MNTLVLRFFAGPLAFTLLTVTASRLHADDDANTDILTVDVDESLPESPTLGAARTAPAAVHPAIAKRRGVGLSKPARNTLGMSQKIYQALDSLDTNRPNKFDDARLILTAAIDWAAKPEIEQLLRDAIDQLSVKDEGGRRHFPSREQIGLVRAKLQAVLAQTRLQFNQSYWGETEFMLEMAKRHLFTDHADSVSVAFHGITDDAGTVLLTLHLADPRALKYDEDVHQLVTGKRFDGSQATFHVEFVLNTTIEGLTENVTNPADRQKLLSDLLQNTASVFPAEVPLRFSGEILEGELAFRVHAFTVQHADAFFGLMTDGIVNLGPNRHLRYTSDMLGAVAEGLKNPHVGGIAWIQAGVQKAGVGVEKVAQVLQAKIFASGYWVPPTPKTIRVRTWRSFAKWQAAAFAEIKAMEGRMREKGLPAKYIEAAIAKEKVRVAAARTQLLENMRTAHTKVRALQVDPKFLALNQIDQDAKLAVLTRREIGRGSHILKVRGFVLTLPEVVRGISVLYVGTTAYNLFYQYKHATSFEERSFVLQKYGPALAVAVMYFFPFYGEFVALVDLLSFATRPIPYFKIPSSYDMVYGLTDGITNLWLDIAGHGRFDTRALELFNRLQLTPFLKHRHVTHMRADLDDHDSLNLVTFRKYIDDVFKAKAEPTREDYIGLSCAKDDFVSRYKQFTARIFAFVYLLNDNSRDQLDYRIGDLEYRMRAFFEGDRELGAEGYNRRAEGIIREAKDLLHEADLEGVVCPTNFDAFKAVAASR